MLLLKGKSSFLHAAYYDGVLKHCSRRIFHLLDLNKKNETIYSDIIVSGTDQAHLPIKSFCLWGTSNEEKDGRFCETVDELRGCTDIIDINKAYSANHAKLL